MSRQPSTPLFEASELECWRGDRCLFSGLDLALAAGEALQVVGPNGCGKTTLLRAVCGLTRAERGALVFRGAPLDGNPETFRSELVYIGHENGLKSELTALENLRALRDIAARRRVLSLEAALKRVGLEGFEDRPVRTLSSGQRRRVALARLLIAQATLWLLDEPFTALDQAGASLVNVLVEEHLDAGGGIIFTSHIPLALTKGSPRQIKLST
jgi:heme exporter protein A